MRWKGLLGGGWPFFRPLTNEPARCWLRWACRRWSRKRRTPKIAVRAARPPTTPPTIALVFEELE
jgi:hypothetical protein